MVACTLHRVLAAMCGASLALGCAQGATLDDERGSRDPVQVPEGDAAPAPTSPSPPATGITCGAGTKLCAGTCVVPRPEVGCSLSDCTPCPPPPVGQTSVCSGDLCGASSTAPPPDPTSDPPPPDTTSDPPPPDPPPADPDFERCLSLTTEDACSRCVCGACVAQSLACGDTGDATRDQHCTDIVECGRANHCTSVFCYCGTADLTACETTPLGACVAPIQAGAGSSVFTDVANALADPNNAVYRADQVGQCAQASCTAECGF